MPRALRERRATVAVLSQGSAKLWLVRALESKREGSLSNMCRRERERKREKERERERERERWSGSLPYVHPSPSVFLLGRHLVSRIHWASVRSWDLGSKRFTTLSRSGRQHPHKYESWLGFP